MESRLIAGALEYVKKIFEDDFSGHDFFHTFRVYKTATRIAAAEGANAEIVQLAALLHDVDDIKLSPETHENKDNAVKFLTANGVDEATIRMICGIIGEFMDEWNGVR